MSITLRSGSIPISGDEVCGIQLAGGSERSVRRAGVTVRVAGPLVTPLATAVIWVVPGNKPKATPLLALTGATLGALLAHAKMTPVMTLPCWSLAVAVNEAVQPTLIDDSADVTVMVVTVGVLEPPQSTRKTQSRSTAKISGEAFWLSTGESLAIARPFPLKTRIIFAQ
ncbi:MAG: hypothetical protein WCD43_07435 [Candidatus Acidiferrales bacterium]